MVGNEARYYLNVFLRRKWLILLVVVTVTAGFTMYNARQRKMYSAQTSLIIDSKEPRFLDSQIQDVNSDVSASWSSSFLANREFLETQIRIIRSRTVSQRVIEKLGLATDLDFLNLSKIENAERRNELHEKIDPFVILQGKTRVEPVKDSRVAHIIIEDYDADRAALIANELAQAYVDEVVSQKLRVTDNASKWLDERRGALSDTAKASELALYDYRRQSDMLTTSIDDRANMVSQRLQSTSAALNEAQLKIASLNARVAAIKNVQASQGVDDNLWAEALPAARENTTLIEIKRRVLALRSDCSDLASRYFPGHPKLAECRDKLAFTEKDFARELSNIVISSEAELKEATEKERNIRRLLAEAKAEAFEVEKKRLDLDHLKQASDSDKRQYDSVFKRLKDIELSGLLRTSNIRVLDAARPDPKPVRPDLPRGVMMGVGFGIFAALCLALLLEFLDSSVNTQLDIEERLGLPFLGFVPTIPDAIPGVGNRDLYLLREPKSLIAECTRAIRTNLLFMSPDKPFKRMLVTSSGPQEGKSTTVINLGTAMAQSGNKVLVVDTDMRRPRLHRAFGVPNDVGVSSLVVGEGDIHSAIKATEVPGLFVLPCGPVPPNPAELLHTKAFSQLLDKLGEHFDRIILDSPPVGAVADAVVLATQAEGVLVILKAGRTHRDVALRTVRSLRDVKANIFGAVLNNVDLAKSKYGEYYYGYAYKYYGYGEQQKGAQT
jgi:capsular exopolysaccharide synthesis family protein